MLNRIRKPKTKLLILAAALACLSVGVTACSAKPIASAVFQDNTVAPLSEKLVGVAKDNYGTTTTLTYIGNEGDAVPAVLVVPVSATMASPVPCVILIHGIGGSKEQMLPIARLLSNVGYASLTIDLPGFGARASATQQTFGSVDDLARYVASTLTQSVTDLRRGIDLLATQPDIDSHRIGEIGFSLGSFVGVDLAAADPRLRSAALVAAGGGLSSILSFQASRGVSYGGGQAAIATSVKSSKNAQSILAAVDPLTYIAEISPRPVLIENGAEDQIIPPAAARALYAAAVQPKHMDVYAGEGHIPSPLVLYQPLNDFLAKTLIAQPASVGTPSKSVSATAR